MLRNLNRRLEPRQNSHIWVTGVGLYTRRKGGAFWPAYVTRDGRERMHKFSVGAYGEDLARQLAVECREQMIVEENTRRAELAEKYSRWQNVHAHILGAVYGEDCARQFALESRKQMILREIGRWAELEEKYISDANIR